MAITVLDVGNCVPDHASIKSMFVNNFDAKVLQSHAAEDTLQLLRTEKVDLVVVNRKLDQDYSDGIEVIKQIKGDSELTKTPVMLVTNYEEHQQAAQQQGALLGFGKLSLNSPETKKRIAAALANQPTEAS